MIKKNLLSQILFILCFSVIQKDMIFSKTSSISNIDRPDFYGRTALWFAAEQNKPEEIAALVEKGANVNGVNKQIPLCVAACDGNKEAVEKLLLLGANPNITDDDGCTALHCAARGELWLYPSTLPAFRVCHPEKLQDYKDVIALLIKHGANNTVKNNLGRTPSQEACAWQKEFYPECTEFTLAKYIESLTDVKA